MVERRLWLSTDKIGGPKRAKYRKMSDRTRSPRFQDQIARPVGRSGHLRVCVSLHNRQRARKSDLEFELLLLALARVRQVGDESQPRLQLRDRLDETRLCHGLTARA